MLIGRYRGSLYRYKRKWKLFNLDILENLGMKKELMAVVKKKKNENILATLKDKLKSYGNAGAVGWGWKSKNRRARSRLRYKRKDNIMRWRESRLMQCRMWEREYWRSEAIDLYCGDCT